MAVTLPTLKDLSAEAFCRYLDDFLEYELEEYDTRCYRNNTKNICSELLVSLKDDVLLPSTVTEILVSKLGELGFINDLTLRLFDYEHTRMRYLKLPSCVNVTAFGLEILKKHQLKRIELNELHLSLNTLVGLLNPWTVRHLETLKVTNSTLWDPSKMCAISTQLTKLQHLRELDVSYTDFNYHNLDIIANDLMNLEALNISATHVGTLKPLKKCSRLKRLSMADLKLHPKNSETSKQFDHILLNLKNLEHLDVSFEESNGPFDIFMSAEPRYVFRILNYPDQLCNLVSLDISGQKNISETSLVTFLQNHPNLKFLGLMSDAAESKIFSDKSHPEYRPDLKVTGTANIEQVTLAMKLYERRNHFIHKCLSALHTFSENDTLSPRPEIIRLITDQMHACRDVLGVQLCCTSCLFYLTKDGAKDGYSSENIPLPLLNIVVERTLDAMATFPAHTYLQKSALLTLCNDRILQETTMDRYRCARLVANAFCEFTNPSIETLCVAISSVIAAKISSAETALIGSCPRYMSKLLDIVWRKLDDLSIDSTLGYTLSTLWNLTDESPRTCRAFIELDGLKLFTNILQKSRDSESVMTRILGLLNNIAEVASLRHALLNEEIIDSVRSLLMSDSIEISYFSAGVLAHLVSDGVERWTLERIPRDAVLWELDIAILSWRQADREMVAYRSFRPFLPLLRCYSTYQAQLWALWAIQHVLTAHAQRYYDMLATEPDILHDLGCLRTYAHKVVRERAAVILDQMDMFKRKKISSFQF